ncbi:endocuticle structural glycoprotein SgAbd-5-like [Musca vetustissima]|uniref:endocuticle structural glycoprotein SgAbd-5-like n=1 Tax=Musca vetustissima TaxID=27455 RepID=UPI002AB60A01|nr:endocuticle structural glycoprotein SgAbd-5-like [Musca vetustissima]
MKAVLILAISVAFSTVLGAPQQDVQIVELENDNDGTGNYKFRFSLSDGTKQDEAGELKDVQGEEGPVQAVVKTGSYEFTDPEGKLHRVTYTADENGFHPVVES